jgi:hypothetical protein
MVTPSKSICKLYLVTETIDGYNNTPHTALTSITPEQAISNITEILDE